VLDELDELVGVSSGGRGDLPPRDVGVGGLATGGVGDLLIASYDIPINQSYEETCERWDEKLVNRLMI
jgi:hypothetical protein